MTNTQARRYRRQTLAARIRGGLAATEGRPVTDNPYRAGSALSTLWLSAYAGGLSDIFLNEEPPRLTL